MRGRGENEQAEQGNALHSDPGSHELSSAFVPPLHRKVHPWSTGL
ncbi:hypothetical protein BF49_7003 [Bradyrhizobium sp.]|nr:hypothetical protein BF49_7003 [Bradyrhizobium sp.]